MRFRFAMVTFALAVSLAGCGGDNLELCDGCGTPTPTVTPTGTPGTPTPSATGLTPTPTSTPLI